MPSDSRAVPIDSGRSDDNPLRDRHRGGEAGDALLIGFGDWSCLAPLAGIAEIIAPPRDVTPVPFSVPWLLGVTHYRGNLLPLFDLAGFFASLDNELVPHGGEDPKVLVVQHPALPFGCLVPRLIGKRRAAGRARPIEGPIKLPAALLSGVDVQGDQSHPVLDLKALADGLQSGLSATDAGVAAR